MAKSFPSISYDKDLIEILKPIHIPINRIYQLAEYKEHVPVVFLFLNERIPLVVVHMF